MVKVDYDDFPNDYFSAKPKTAEGQTLRKQIIDQVLQDILDFFNKTKGQLAVYDALNILVEERTQLDKFFSSFNIKVLFIESVMTDSEMIKHNVDMASRSADYVDWSQKDAIVDYMHRLKVNRELYEEMTPRENLSYVKYVNFGEQLMVNNNHFGYLVNKIVFFLMNLRDKKGCVYFARCGTSDNDKYVDDEILNKEGTEYSKRLTDLVLKIVNERRAAQHPGFLVPIENEATPNSGFSSRSMSPSLSPLLTCLLYTSRCV